MLPLCPRSCKEFTIPAGLLQAPFFDPAAPAALTYGSAGHIIGQENGFGRSYLSIKGRVRVARILGVTTTPAVQHEPGLAARLGGNAPYQVEIKRRKRARLRRDEAHIRARLETSYVSTGEEMVAAVRAYMYLSSTQCGVQGVRWPFPPVEASAAFTSARRGASLAEPPHPPPCQVYPPSSHPLGPPSRQAQPPSSRRPRQTPRCGQNGRRKEGVYSEPRPTSGRAQRTGKPTSG